MSGSADCKPAGALRRAFAGAQLAAIAAAMAVLWAHHPGEIGLPACPLFRLAHVYCPGCGSTRAVHFLLRAEVALAWRHNPAMVVLGVPVLLVYMWVLMRALVWGGPLTQRTPAWLAWGAAGALVVYGILRNVPVDALEWMRPPG